MPVQVNGSWYDVTRDELAELAASDAPASWIAEALLSSGVVTE